MEYTTRLDADPRKAQINYQCPCGCTAGVLYEKGEGALDVGECCCGRRLLAGPGALERVNAAVEAGVDYEWDLGKVTLPWGEVVDTALAAPRDEPVEAMDSHGHDHDHGDHDHHPAAKLVRDVVCGMMIDPETAAARSDYKGQTYYFCATGCKASFEADPAQYVTTGRSFLGRLLGRRG